MGFGIPAKVAQIENGRPLQGDRLFGHQACLFPFRRQHEAARLCLCGNGDGAVFGDGNAFIILLQRPGDRQAIIRIAVCRLARRAIGGGQLFPGHRGQRVRAGDRQFLDRVSFRILIGDGCAHIGRVLPIAAVRVQHDLQRVALLQRNVQGDVLGARPDR